jgi:hypothetical protein
MVTNASLTSLIFLANGEAGEKAASIRFEEGFAGIPLTVNVFRGEQRVQLAQFLCPQIDVERAKIFFQMPLPPGARYCGNVLSFVQNPGKRNLPGGMLFSLRQLLEPTDELKVTLEILFLEAR